jgi:predicted DNA-binding protein
MKYTQLRLKVDYREKLKILADRESRSMANMVEVLIDQAYTRLSKEERTGEAR